MRNTGGKVEFVGSFPGSLPDLGRPEVAFAGRSNVGKSSALNCLLDSKKAARVSSTPGRTQAINLFCVGDALIFADLPGYGFAKVPGHVRQAWGPMIEGYLGTRESLRLVVLLVDIRRDPMSSDGDLIRGLQDARIPLLVVATKSDKLKRQRRLKQLVAIREAFALPPDQPLPFSSHTRDGRSAVWDVIEAAAR